MSEISKKLKDLYLEVAENIDFVNPFLENPEALEKVIVISTNIRNKAPIRFLLSCLAAKLDRPDVDIRKPYTQIGEGSFSGRFYDERYVQEIISEFNLPCNPTTAYLTPALRNRNVTMTSDIKLEGRPKEVYQYALDLLNLVYEEAISPTILLKEIYRQLIFVRDQNERRIGELIAALKTTKGAQPLSSEQIITIIQQHLISANASRLPTLIVDAAYSAVGEKIGEYARPLNAHNAADSQTGAFGDIEITLCNDENIITCYEMKDKRVTTYDIDLALQKVAKSKNSLDNYIFITTDVIDPLVEEYARNLYNETGVEFAILDCIGFIRHFLHFFHRSRTQFLEAYQDKVLAEPNSSVGQPLKEVFLALRAAAEAG